MYHSEKMASSHHLSLIMTTHVMNAMYIVIQIEQKYMSFFLRNLCKLNGI